METDFKFKLIAKNKNKNTAAVVNLKDSDNLEEHLKPLAVSTGRFTLETYKNNKLLGVTTFTCDSREILYSKLTILIITQLAHTSNGKPSIKLYDTVENKYTRVTRASSSFAISTFDAWKNYCLILSYENNYTDVLFPDDFTTSVGPLVDAFLEFISKTELNDSSAEVIVYDENAYMVCKCSYFKTTTYYLTEMLKYILEDTPKGSIIMLAKENKTLRKVLTCSANQSDVFFDVLSKYVK